MDPSQGSVPHPRRFQTEWRLLFAAAELGWLVVFAVAERAGLRRLVGRTRLGRSALRYALLEAAVLVAGYVLLRLVLGAVYRRSATRLGLGEVDRAALPSAGDVFDDFDGRRLERSVLLLGAVMLCFAFFTGPAWVIVALLLVGVLTALEYTRDRDRVSACGTPVTEAEQAAWPALDGIVTLARRRGHEHVDLLVYNAEPGDPPAAAIPAGPQPRIALAREALSRLPARELQAAAAHELAHHELRHSRSGAVVEAASRLGSGAALCAVLGAAGRAGRATSAAQLLPTAVLAWYLLRVGGVLIERAAMRHQERHAHRRAVAITGDASAYLAVLAKLAPDEPAPGWERKLLAEAPDRRQVEHIVRQACGDGTARR
ncbi:MAG: M48 family metalloprotease [Planctomycetota bacterium]